MRANDLLQAFESVDLTPGKRAAEGPIEDTTFVEPKGNGGRIADDNVRDLSKVKGTIAQMTESLMGRMEGMTREALVAEWTTVLKEANSRSKRGSMSAKKLLLWIADNKNAGKTAVMHRITSSYLAGAGMEVA